MDYIDKLFANASREQCWGFLGCAGEIANNVFAAGGHAITLRAGNWHPAQPELWVPGYNKESDVITLDASAHVDPYKMEGVDQNEDAFSVPFYELDVGQGHDKRPRTIAESLNMEAIPVLAASDATLIKFKHWDPFYSLKKVISDFWGTLLQRGGLEIGVRIFQSPQEVENISQTVQKTVGVDEEGKPVLVPHTTTNPTPFIPVYLAFDKGPEIEMADAVSIRSFESAYDPTWILSGLLTGEYAKHNTFQSDGGER